VSVLEGGAAPIDILIAEDDALQREYLRQLLEQEGYRCAVAADGRQAVALAQQRPPQYVLLDLRMPGLDGFSVARQLRADPRTRGAAIHCLTGQTDEATRAAAQRAGCERLLTKPINATTLLEVVRRQMSRATEWVRGLTKAESEELLDWLEAQGVAGELALAGQGFAVRCPGLFARRDASGRAVLCRP
jgi:CheY-like chemotaxis protein